MHNERLINIQGMCVVKAIILSAGQGRRLLPHTASAPKCALRVGSRSILEWQVDTLLAAGIGEIVVVTGYKAEAVRGIVSRRYPAERVTTIRNPLHGISDNLVSCWVARDEMDGDFLLLNGDTLFENAILEHLLIAPERPITLTIDRKASYDSDDMKVSLHHSRLQQVGKCIEPTRTHAEAIGVALFRGEGVERFRSALAQAMSRSGAYDQWYLSVINELARARNVWTRDIHGLEWIEIDDAIDLEAACRVVSRWSVQGDGLGWIGRKGSGPSESGGIGRGRVGRSMNESASESATV